MNAYKNYINDLARNSKNVVFLNSSAAHASIVMSTLFQHAKKDVKLFAGNLRGDVSKGDEYKNNLNEFLRNDGRIQILLEEFDEKNPPNIIGLLRLYKISSSSKVEVKTHKHSVILNNTNNKIHFCVADDKMYRLESDTTNYLAEGNFNDPLVAKKLSSIFNEIFDDSQSTRVDLFK